MKRRELIDALPKRPDRKYEFLTAPHGTIWTVITKGDKTVTIGFTDGCFTINRSEVRAGQYGSLEEAIEIIENEEAWL